MLQAIDRLTLNKVPLVTLFFWIIKILATTVGETGADFLNFNLGFGLTKTSLLAALILIGFLALQMRRKRYVPWIYWVCVVFLSVVGTLLTDSLSDTFGVSLYVSTALFAVGLAITFIAWYRSEHTLSIHDITTPRREAYYWAAILFTFALGTAAGDMTATTMHLGYFASGVLFTVLIALAALAYWRFGLNEILAFWCAYIVTRPLGASFADWAGRDQSAGGLGLGTGWVSLVLMIVIVIAVGYLSVTHKDITVEQR